MAGALSTGLLVALFAGLALRPPMPRRSSRFNIQFALGWVINEQPVLGLWWLLAGTAGTVAQLEIGDPVWALVAGLALLDALILGRLAVRMRSARPALSAAFDDAFGAGAAPTYTRPPWWRIVLVPIISWRPDVRRIRNRRYGPARRGNRLDVYVSRRRRRTRAPVLVHLHGGGFAMGSKMLGARPLLYRLAARGWVCISADYRLRGADYRDQLDDVRAALAWTRANASTYGGDPDSVFLAGGSAGAHLGATAALTGTRVRGLITLYGYYGNVGGSNPISAATITPVDVPPTLIVHGALDTLVLRGDARAFAHRLRALSRKPVVYAELPGTHHNFDFFHSPRVHAVTDAVIHFAQLTFGGQPRDSKDVVGPAARRG